MPTAAGHPSAAALAAFALGKLEPPAAETVNDHLNGCADWRTVVETTPNDSLAALLRLTPGESPSQAGAAGPGTRQVSNPSFDKSELPPELHDHPRYRIVRKLGQGGMGAVYQAEHKLMGRTVAVKVIAPALVDSPDAIERFQREVRAAAKLEHVNIVRAYDADTAGTAMLLAMEFVKGRTLAELVAAKGPLPVGFACQCVRQAALGLQQAADHCMVHRDIKPANLMLTDERVVKILDFGLAKLASERASQAGLTGKNIVMGTPEYMAPEQARNTAGADIRADIYSLGCTLYYLLTGRPPFRGESAIEVLTRHATEAPPRVTEVRPEVSAGLAELVERLLAKDPAGRPQTPREVAEALRAFVKPAGGTPEAVPAKSVFARLSNSTSVRRPEKNKRWWPLAVATAGFAGLLLAFAIISIQNKDGSATRIEFPEAATVEVPQAEKNDSIPSSEPPRLVPASGLTLAPENTEWAGIGTIETKDGTRRPIVITLTITESRGGAFKASVRGMVASYMIEGSVDNSGGLTYKVSKAIGTGSAQFEGLAGAGEIIRNRMTLVIKNPDTSSVTRLDLKLLPDAGATFNFIDSWKCFHQPTGWNGQRRVISNTTFIHDSRRGTWTRDGGLIQINFSGGGNGWLAIDADNPNVLNGGAGLKTVQWIRQ